MITESKILHNFKEGIRLRRNQKNDEAWMLYLENKSALNNPLTKKSNDLIVEFYGEILKASLERQKGSISDSLTTLRSLERRYPIEVWGKSFDYYLEQGLTYFADQKYDKALDYFYIAKPLSEQKGQRFSLLINILFTLSQLGHHDLKLETELFELSNTIDDEEYLGAKNQFEYFLLKKYYLEAQFKKIETLKNAPASQTQYYYQYLSRLPYLKIPSNNFDNLNLRNIYLGKLRLRTISFSYHPDDAQSFYEYEAIDRIYLWVWNWLANPEKVGLIFVADFLKALPKVNINNLKDENKLKLRNALSWINLFSEADLSPLIQKIKIGSKNQDSYKVFELEYNFYHYCHALKNNQVSLQQALINEINLDKNTYCQFSTWIKNKNFLPLASLDLPEIINDAALYTVNVANNVIKNIKSDEVLVSSILSKTIGLTHNKSIVPISDICQYVYGVSLYDPTLHLGKIRILLTKLKQFTHNLFNYRVSGEQVHITCNWGKFHVVQESIFQKDCRISHIEEYIRKVFETNTSEFKSSETTNTQRPQKKLNQILKRQDVEQLLNISRSGAGRKIAEFLGKGLIVKDGETRGAVYRVVESKKIELEKELNL